MNSTIFLILYISILILTGKYIVELKSDKTLVVVLVLFGNTCLGYILKYIFHAPLFISIGLISGMIVAPIILSIYLLRLKGNKKEKSMRFLMLIPTVGIFINYLFKALHMPGAEIINILMIISITVGGYIVLKNPQLKEIRPFQVMLIFIIIDVLTFLMK